MTIFGLPLLKVSLWANAGLLAAVAAVGLWQQGRVGTARIGEANAIRDLGTAMQMIAEQRVNFETEARQRERAASDELQARLAEAEEKRRHDEDAANAVIADLRNGNRRLRGEWAACTAAAASLPEGADDPGLPESGSDDVAGAVGRVLGIGARADDRYRQLLSIVLAYEKVCGP